MKVGDVIFTWFPYDDLQDFKLRPAVVLLISGPRYICAPLTTSNNHLNWAVRIKKWKQAGLLKPCKVKIDTLFTISNYRHYKHIGRLQQKDKKDVLQCFKNFLLNTDSLDVSGDRRVVL